MKKALALFSGGLDSMLACAITKRAGASVEAVHIQTGFGSPNVAKLQARANAAGASFRLVDISSEYLQKVLLSPKYGYGKAINPCIDCHGFMFATVLSMLEDLGADFVISGEVLGQRPMSQRAQALNSVKKLAGDKAELIVRPMSALLLEPSLPERLGWIDRSKLLGLSGRGRSAQIALASELGFSDYESPAGGCLLTLMAFKDKAIDAMKNSELNTPAEAKLLQYGRHLRLDDGAKLVISRNEAEGEILRAICGEIDWMHFIDLGASAYGALSFIGAKASISQKDLNTAVSLAKAYARGFSDEVCCAGLKSSAAQVDKLKAQKYFIAK